MVQFKKGFSGRFLGWNILLPLFGGLGLGLASAHATTYTYSSSNVIGLNKGGSSWPCGYAPLGIATATYSIPAVSDCSDASSKWATARATNAAMSACMIANSRAPVFPE